MRSVGRQNDHLYFEEAQHFARWIRVTVLLPVAVLGCLSLALLVEGSTNSALVPGGLAMIFLLLAVPNFVIQLVTKLDGRHLHLRIDPSGLRMPFLPPRVQDIPLSDISHCEVRTYRVLFDREYWGRHFWGLGTAFRGGAWIYMMNTGILSGTGVQLQLRSGERILVGSQHPEALAIAITRAKSDSP
jgi:hypothetical protein